MFSKCIFAGVVANTPDPRVTATGKKVVNFRLQTDKQYHSVVAWEDLAEKAIKLKVGDLVYVESQPRHRSYDDKEGRKVWVTEFVASEIRTLTALTVTTPESDDDLPANF